MLKILELRQRAKNNFGDGFDIRQFHDVVPKRALPLDILEERVNEWIDQSIGRLNRMIQRAKG